MLDIWEDNAVAIHRIFYIREDDNTAVHHHFYILENAAAHLLFYIQEDHNDDDNVCLPFYIRKDDVMSLSLVHPLWFIHEPESHSRVVNLESTQSTLIRSVRISRFYFECAVNFILESV